MAHHAKVLKAINQSENSEKKNSKITPITIIRSDTLIQDSYTHTQPKNKF